MLDSRPAIMDEIQLRLQRQMASTLPFFRSPTPEYELPSHHAKNHCESCLPQAMDTPSYT